MKRHIPMTGTRKRTIQRKIHITRKTQEVNENEQATYEENDTCNEEYNDNEEDEENDTHTDEQYDEYTQKDTQKENDNWKDTYKQNYIYTEHRPRKMKRQRKIRRR